MQYENPDIPEGINDSERRPLGSFLKLSAAAFALVAAAGIVLVALADRLAPLVPFHYEAAIAAELFPPSASDGPVEPYLRRLAARLAAAQGLPEGMAVQVHYTEADVVNAFATLGGHVVVYRGLLAAMPDENALAMVLAHEIAHVRHRHPIATAGRSAALGLLLAAVGAGAGGEAVRAGVSHGGGLTMLSFSRAQEAEADATALETVARVYGHVDGADGFLRAALERAASAGPPGFLSSHPLNAERIGALAALAGQRGWRRSGPRTPIPEPVRARLVDSAR